MGSARGCRSEQGETEGLIFVALVPQFCASGVSALVEASRVRCDGRRLRSARALNTAGSTFGCTRDPVHPLCALLRGSRAGDDRLAVGRREPAGCFRRTAPYGRERNGRAGGLSQSHGTSPKRMTTGAWRSSMSTFRTSLKTIGQQASSGRRFATTPVDGG